MNGVTDDARGKGAALSALDRLQASLRDRQVNVARWAQELKDERYEATRQLSF